MPETGSVETLTRRVAAFGLPEGERLESLQVPAEDWQAFLASLVHQRLSGLAMAMATAEDCRLALTDEQTEELLTWHRRFMLHALTLERELLALASSFEDADIASVVLKGPAVAHTCYPDTSWRPFGDLDVLVHVRDFQRACRVLAELGFGRVFPEPRPRFVERFGHTALHRSRENLEIDLHRTLIPGPFGQWIDPGALMARTVSFSLGGRSLRRLDDTALLLHACVHASLGARPPLLLPVRDVAQVIASAQLDWELLAEWGRRWRLHAVLRHALETASGMLRWEIPAQARQLMTDPRRRERRALEAYTTSRRNKGGQTLETVWAIRGIRAKSAYVRALLVPSHEFLQAREGNTVRASYLRRWKVPVRWLAARYRDVAKASHTGAEMTSQRSWPAQTGDVLPSEKRP